MNKFTLYLDESGATSFTQRTPQSQGSHFAIGALAVERNEDASLAAYKVEHSK
jgi:hypothetical protein